MTPYDRSWAEMKAEDERAVVLAALAEAQRTCPAAPPRRPSFMQRLRDFASGPQH